MRVLIRVDCSPTVGMGHATRCLALAQQLAGRGAEVVFASREPVSMLPELCSAAGHVIRTLPGPNAGWEEDAAQTKAVLIAVGWPDWVVVDHYGLDARWERKLRPHCGAMLAVDDLADRDHDCDVLLDQNFHRLASARYRNLVPAACHLLLGPRYALLRGPLWRSAPRTRDGVLRRALISYGGSDPTGETLKALSAISLAELPDLHVRVVIGPDNPRALEVRERCAQLPDTEPLDSVKDMFSLMAESDIAIGAGGVSMWERCAVGLPSIVTAVARNQEPSSQAMGEAGMCVYLGVAAETSAQAIADALRGLATAPALVRYLAASSRTLVDGDGARRVADRMLWPEVSLRRAASADCDMAFAWRNHPSVRKNSRNPSELEIRSHQAWFAAALADESRELLIVEFRGSPVGALRYDIDGEVARCSVFLDSGSGGRGIGSAALEKGTAWLQERRPAVRRIEADVLSHNLASLNAFANAGFTPARQVLERMTVNEP